MSSDDLPAIMPQGPPDNPLEVVPLETVEIMERSRIDMQISAANRKPRPDIEVIEARITKRAARRVDIAGLCYYSLPRFDKDSGKNKLIHGASIKLANISLGEFGNTLSGAQTIGNDGKVIRARGICWDLQTNNQKFVEVGRRILDKHGRPYSYDMQVTTAAAANSIAERNAILKVLGEDIFTPAYLECMKVVAGTNKDLIERRDKMLKWFSFRGVKYDQMLALLDKSAVDQLDVDDVAYMSGIANAIRDKELTVEEAFNVPADEERKSGGKRGYLRQLRDERKAQKEAAAEQPEGEEQR
jgi:hypothetical protein